MRLFNANWDEGDLPKGQKSNVQKWNEILNQEVTVKVFNLIKNKILNQTVNTNDAMQHALANAKRQGAVEVLRDIFDLGQRPKLPNEEIGEPWEYVQPKEGEL